MLLVIWYLFRLVVSYLVASHWLDADEEGVDQLPSGYELLDEVAVDQAGLGLRDKGFNGALLFGTESCTEPKIVLSYFEIPT